MSVLDDIFSGTKSLIAQAGSLAPTAAAWKELIDPVRAVQQPTLGTGSGTPIIQPPAGAVSKTPGVTSLPSTTLYVGVAAVVLIIIVLLTRKT